MNLQIIYPASPLPIRIDCLPPNTWFRFEESEDVVAYKTHDLDIVLFNKNGMRIACRKSLRSDACAIPLATPHSDNPISRVGR